MSLYKILHGDMTTKDLHILYGGEMVREEGGREARELTDNKWIHLFRDQGRVLISV